jgi:hypothetical protein
MPTPPNADKEALIHEVVWLMDNSEGVMGLRMDGGLTTWTEVRDLYLLHWHDLAPNDSSETP